MTLMSALTPSKNGPSGPQVGKLEERLHAAARKSGITSGQFQIALAHPGTELEDGIAALIVQFANKAGGIITPVRAQDTGLVPGGWSVESDNLEGNISIANLDYSSCPVRAGESHVSGHVVLARAGNAHGSLGFAAALIRAQDRGEEIFPVKSRGRHCFLMPRTILLDDYRNRRVSYFNWRDERWVFYFRWLDSDFDGDDRFVRPRELPLGA
jgi:hypothetical protein